MENKPMTKRRLEQYKSLQREIAMLETRILSATSSGDIVTDMVRGSAPEHPYTQRSIIIQGSGSPAVRRMTDKRRTLEMECTAVEEYIEAVDDSIMRQILTWRYLAGETIEETGRMVGYSGARIKQLLQKFFETLY